MSERERFEDARLRAFCEGLEVQSIDLLMTGSIGDFRALGELMASRTKDLAAKKDAEIERLREVVKANHNIHMEYGKDYLYKESVLYEANVAAFAATATEEKGDD